MAVSEWKELESKNNSLEKDIPKKLQGKFPKKNRQLEVKNEEYQALENEISLLAELLSGKEDEQIEVLVKIDDAQATALIAQDKITLKVKELEQQKVRFEDRINKVKTVMMILKIEEARESIDTDILGIMIE